MRTGRDGRRNGRTKDGGSPSEIKVRSNSSYIPSVLSRPSPKSNHSSLGIFFLVTEQYFPSSLVSNLSVDQPEAAFPQGFWFRASRNLDDYNPSGETCAGYGG